VESVAATISENIVRPTSRVSRYLGSIYWASL